VTLISLSTSSLAAPFGRRGIPLLLARFRRLLNGWIAAAIAHHERRAALVALRPLDDRALKDVGYRVGYDSEIAFARAYKRFYGMTPRDYCKAESMVAKKYNLMLDHWSDFMDPYC